MTVVVDASVAVKWFVAEEGRDAAMDLFRSTIEKWAPDIVFAEVANVLRRKLQTGEVSDVQADQAIEKLPDLFAQVVPSVDLIRDAWRLLKRSTTRCTTACTWPTPSSEA